MQLFVPLLSPHLEGGSAAGAAAEQPRRQAQQQPAAAGVFGLLEEVAMRQAGGLTGEDIDRGMGQPLEQLGVSLTFGECLCSSALSGHGKANPAKMNESGGVQQQWLTESWGPRTRFFVWSL